MAKVKSSNRAKATNGKKVVSSRKIPVVDQPDQMYLDDDMAPVRIEAVDKKGKELLEAIQQRKAWNDTVNSSNCERKPAFRRGS